MNRSIILILLCLITLALLYEFVPRCERRVFNTRKSVVKRDGDSHIVLSLSDDNVAKFYAVPKREVESMKPVNYNNYVYYFYGDGIHKKQVESNETVVVLNDTSTEAQFVTNVRRGHYRLVHTEPNYSFRSSTSGISSKDYDLVVRTAH